jgi:hypothetical protein
LKSDQQPTTGEEEKMELNPLTLIDKLINERGSAQITRDNLIFLRDQIVACKEQVTVLKEEKALLKKENAVLKGKVLFLTTQTGELTRQKEDLNLVIERDRKGDEFPGNKCPYCQRPAGALVDIKPHPYFPEAGLKVGNYQCQHCQRTYEEDIRPGRK